MAADRSTCWPLILLTAGLLIVVVGILLMVAARWANATAIAICIVALLHDAVVAWCLVPDPFERQR